jgi:multidrug transporter EmrE-like cation transporter
MDLPTLALILVSVSLSAVAQVAFKFGVSARSAEGSLMSGLQPGGVLMLLSAPGVLLGLALYGVGTILWLNALARVQLSQAYPFVGLGFVLTAVFGYLLFGDSFSPYKLAGTLLVITGIVLVGSGR